MKLNFFLNALWFILIPAAVSATVAEPGAQEIVETNKWFGTNLGPGENNLPFSFTYGQKSSKTLLQNWEINQSRRRLDVNRTEYLTACKDPQTGLLVPCTTIQYHDFPAEEWLVEFENQGEKDSEIIEDIQSLDFPVEGTVAERFILNYALGDHNSAESFAPKKKELEPGKTTTFKPRAGRSSDPYLPFFNVAGQDGGIVIAVGWSGQWQGNFERKLDGSLQIRIGLETAHFKLYPGEKIRVPRILVIKWEGDDPLAGNNLLRQVLLKHYFPRRQGELVLPPICASVTEVDPDGSYEKPHVRIMPFYAKCGIEVFWSDMDPQQWYPGGFPAGTGTWEPDPAKYPRGLKPIGDAAHAAGLEYLLWFEPERVQPETRIFKEHSQWLLACNGNKQLFGLHNAEARLWLTDYIDVQITAAQLDWIRWDFNMDPLGFWRQNESPDRQGMVEIGYIMGLYAMWEDLQNRHPKIIIDNCSSGGRRIDLESCRYGLPLWHSDMQCSGPQPNAEQLQNAGLFRWVPLHGCASFDLEPSYKFRSSMTLGNILIPSITKSPESAPGIERTAATYKKNRPYMLGDFYPLLPHQADDNLWFGYQFHRPDLDAGMAVLFRREKNTEASRQIGLKGLTHAATYEITVEDTAEKFQVEGNAVTTFTASIPEAPGSIILFYQKTK